MDGNKPLISIVVPVFNEEVNIFPFYEALVPITQQLRSECDFEFVFTDNHSTDRTPVLLRELARKDPRVRAYRFSRNFGYQRSIMTGYAKAKGAAAVQLDCDLQDPPELLGEFLRIWRDEGADVVYGVRVKRQESWSNQMSRVVFYRLIDKLSEDKIPVDAGDFRLISRRVIDLLKEYEDPQPYLRGTIAAMGFKQVGVPYHRNARTRGESKFSFSKMVALALDGILNHSTVPLRFSTFFGLLVSLLTFLLVLGYTAFKLLTKAQWPAGFTTLVAIQLGSLSINAMFLGIIGEYLGRLYTASRRRPLTIIEDVIHLSAHEPTASMTEA
ncbi:MAG TPA: glycosyltransferase family 2 protein [Acidisarcina sp.]